MSVADRLPATTTPPTGPQEPARGTDQLADSVDWFEGTCARGDDAAGAGPSRSWPMLGAIGDALTTSALPVRRGHPRGEPGLGRRSGGRRLGARSSCSW